MGDYSSSLLVRKRGDWWFHIVLDFDIKEFNLKIVIIKSVRELYLQKVLFHVSNTS